MKFLLASNTSSLLDPNMPQSIPFPDISFKISMAVVHKMTVFFFALLHHVVITHSNIQDPLAPNSVILKTEAVGSFEMSEYIPTT